MSHSLCDAPPPSPHIHHSDTRVTSWFPEPSVTPCGNGSLWSVSMASGMWTGSLTQNHNYIDVRQSPEVDCRLLGDQSIPSSFLRLQPRERMAETEGCLA